MVSPKRKRSQASNATSSSVNRAFAVLEVVSVKGDAGASIMETAKKLHLSKSTTHRYLLTLERLGAVERDPRDRYHLGLKMIELAGFTLSQSDLRKQADPFLRRLADETNETAHLAVLSGTEVVYIAKADSEHSIRMFSHIGARRPMYCTALGKAILAHSPAALVDQVILAGLVPRTPNTLTRPEVLLDELARTRARGFSVDNQENELGVSCVGAAVFDYSARAIGAISVSGPAERMSESRQRALGPVVRNTALEISKRMGYVGWTNGSARHKSTEVVSRR